MHIVICLQALANVLLTLILYPFLLCLILFFFPLFLSISNGRACVRRLKQQFGLTQTLKMVSQWPGQGLVGAVEAMLS